MMSTRRELLKTLGILPLVPLHNAGSWIPGMGEAVIGTTAGQTGKISASINGAFNRKKAEEALFFSAGQYEMMLKKIPDNAFPRTADPGGKIVTTASESWTSGFYPGVCWYLYEHTGREAFRMEAINKSMLLEKEKFNTLTHDLGFMLYCSLGNGYRLTGSENFRDILLKGARSLVSRYDPDVGCIRSWEREDKSLYLVIIDNMMNLELLFWSYEVTRDPLFLIVGIHHADNTLKNHFRDDYSSFHVVDYDPGSGRIKKRQTVQGYADGSAWARGQSWGLYGYTMSYRMTGRKRYLEQAVHIADFFLSHPRLPEDRVPYWDYDAPGIPDEPRDASAGAIMASALLELSSYVSSDRKRKFIRNSEMILNTLSGPGFRAEKGENGFFILKHSVGNLPGGTEIDVPLIYADYYYVEALMRYLKFVH